MRLHVRPGQGSELDVEVATGTPAGRLRAHLGLLTADPHWALGPLWVGRAALSDEHPAGVPPLVDGVEVAYEAAPGDEAAKSVRAGRHLAVLAGPGAGGVLALPARQTGILPASWTGGDVVRVRRRRLVVLHGPGLAVRRRARRRPGRTRWGPRLPFALLRVGDQVRGPGWLAELRTEPSPGRRRRLSPARTLSLVAGLAGPALLALTTRQWLYLLLAVTGPAMAVSLPPPATSPEPVPAPTDIPGLRLALARRRLGLAEVPEGQVPWGDDGALLVTGPYAHDVAAAFVLLSSVGSAPLRLSVLTRDPSRWRWVGWLAARDTLPTDQDEACVVVADDPADPATLATWYAANPRPHHLLLVASDDDVAPAWPTDRLVTAAELRESVDGHRVRVELPAVGSDLVLDVAREVASTAQADEAAHPPDSVSLGGLGSMPDPNPADIDEAWNRPRAGLVLPLGRTAGGQPFLLDLVRDGPHLLIGGTTGSGKSGLLVTLVLAAAACQPPERLAMLLVDFKGGTGVGAVGRLPHVLEHLSDLEPARATRTLTGLGAELRRRERILATAGVSDLCELDPAGPLTPPRLLVVVDEFRALLDDVPSSATVLARLAAQGRALGVHLVLATQRPGGAVGPDLRANVSARIALRVADPQDSTDLLGTPDAVQIDRRTPGRAHVRLGADQPLEVQLARAVAQPTGCDVRLAPAWPDGRGWRPPAPAGDDSQAWVAAITRAAAGRPLPAVPWLPELGTVVRLDEVPPGTGLPLAVVDRPELAVRERCAWDPLTGHLLVVGAPGSGRTGTLLAAGSAALAAGYQVHAVGLPPAARDRLRSHDVDARLGTLAEHDEALVVARLLELLEAPSGVRRLLLVDGLEQTLESLARIARGAGADRLSRWWTAPAPAGSGPALAASTGPGPLATRAAGAFADRLVLGLRDAGAAAMLGVPSSLAHGGPPGRAVHLSELGPRSCQVVHVADRPSTDRRDERRPSTADFGAGGGRRRVAPGPVRLAALPRRIAAPTVEEAGPDAVVIGHGGDRGEAVRVGLGPTFLVAGPPGSGRSTALRRLRRAAQRSGHRVLDDGWTSADVTPGDGRPAVIVLDDLDELETTDPGAAQRLEQLLLARRRGDASAWVLATTTTDHAATAFRGPTALLVRARRLLVLDPVAPGALDLLGPKAAWLADPLVRVPGRAVLRLGRELTALQAFEEERIAIE